MSEEFRDLTEREREILYKLLQRDFPGREVLLNQVQNSKVRVIKEYKDNWGSLEFRVNTNTEASVNGRVPVQATAYDSDGVPVQIFLHVVDGKLNELEIVKADNSKIIKRLSAQNFIIDEVLRE